MNASDLPSGDHSGNSDPNALSDVGLGPRFLTVPPAAGTTARTANPFRPVPVLPVNAKVLPSGDQRGVKSKPMLASIASYDATLLGLVPSAPMTQTSNACLESRYRLNADLLSIG